MDPVKCLEILGSRGTCSGSHDAFHGHTDPTPSQAAAEAAAATVRGGTVGGGGGQVINLATGTNETRAATEAASGLMAGLSALNGGDAGETPSSAAPYAGNHNRWCSGSSGGGSSGGDDGRCANRGRKNGSGEACNNTGPAARAAGAASAGESTGGADHGDAVGDEVRPTLMEPRAVVTSAAAAAAAEKEAGVLDGLEGMSAGALVASFLRAQEERVVLYNKFNGGLKKALRNGDYSGYPALCCEVTAGFSVLSKAINAVESLLSAKAETKPLATIIRRVQEHEQEKLTVTAAHHLESMREARALGMGPGMAAHAGGGGGGGARPASRVQDRLLTDGVAELLSRAEGEASAISALLEELRYEAEELT